MGSNSFLVTAEGATAQDAFNSAKYKAQYESGHGGYTGTIAEKDRFTIIEIDEGVDVEWYVQCMIDADDPRICDKWGPAGAVDLGNRRWLFFGWASS